MSDLPLRLIALAEELIRDVEDTCDCGDHVAQIKVYRERLDALAGEADDE